MIVYASESRSGDWTLRIPHTVPQFTRRRDSDVDLSPYIPPSVSDRVESSGLSAGATQTRQALALVIMHPGKTSRELWTLSGFPGFGYRAVSRGLSRLKRLGLVRGESHHYSQPLRWWLT